MLKPLEHSVRGQKMLCMIKNYISTNELSYCRGNNCVNIKGDVVKIVTFSIAFFIVSKGISQFINTQK